MQPTQSKSSHPADPATVPPSGADAPTLSPAPWPSLNDLRGLLSPPRGPDELGWLAHYRILKQLGAGGMGMVFLAEDSHLQRQVALKIMLPALAVDPANRERFLREARAAAALSHDHVVMIHQVGEERGMPFLAMQLLQGESLDDYLRRGKKISFAQACRVGRETAIGLSMAHARGLVHRDIKPANLWLEAPKGRVKILDFGLARTSSDSNLTGSGFVIGTPTYMSPEQARSIPLDGRADLWSVGVVLYRLTTGRLPFLGDDMIAIISAIALDTPPKPTDLVPDLPPPLAELIVQLLEKDRDKRPKTAQEVADRLLKIERSLRTGTAMDVPIRPQPKPLEPITATIAPRRPRLARSRGRSHFGLIATITAVVLGLGAASIWFFNSKRNAGSAEPLALTESQSHPDDDSAAPPNFGSSGKIKGGPNKGAGGKASPSKAGAGKAGKVDRITVSNPPAMPASAGWTSRSTESGFAPGRASIRTLVTFIDDGKTLLVVDAERIWRKPLGGKAVGKLHAQRCRELFQAEPISAALSPNGKLLALGLRNFSGGGGRAVLWNIDTNEPMQKEPPNLLAPPYAIAFGNNNLLGVGVDSAVDQFRIRGGDLATGRGLPRADRVTAIAYSPDGALIAIGMETGELRVRDRVGETQLWSDKAVAKSITTLVWSPDSSRLAATTTDGMHLFQRDGTLIATLPSDSHSAAFSPDSRLVATFAKPAGADSQSLVLSDAATGQQLKVSAAEHTMPVPSAAFGPAGRSIISLCRSGHLKFWDVPSDVLAAVSQ